MYFFQAAWGGGLLMSDKYKPLRFLGVDRADSLTWNPHKLLGVLLQCSTFHTKEHVSVIVAFFGGFIYMFTITDY